MREQEMAVNVAKQIYFIEYTDKIIDEILKQLVVLGGEQNSRT